MGIFDKAKDLLAEHNETVDSGIDRAAGLVDERTGGQHSEHIAGAGEQAKQRIDDFAGTAQDPTTTGPADAVDPEARI